MVAAPVPELQVHRSTFAVTFGVVFVVVGLLMVADGVAHRSSGHAVTVAMLGLVVIAGSVVIGIHPSVAETATGVIVTNPLRTSVVPWSELTDADVADVLRVHAGATVIRCFAVPRKGRPPMRVPGSPVTSTTRSITPSMIAIRLTDIAERERIGHYDRSDVITSWAPLGVGAIVVSVLAIVVAFLGAQ